MKYIIIYYTVTLIYVCKQHHSWMIVGYRDKAISWDPYRGYHNPNFDISHLFPSKPNGRSIFRFIVQSQHVLLFCSSATLGLDSGG